MKQRFIHKDIIKIMFPAVVIIFVLAAWLLLLDFIASRGRSDFYYITGDVTAVQEHTFDLLVLPDLSKTEKELKHQVYHFKISDFSGESPVPYVGERIRITCSHDMRVLIAIYNAETLEES